MKRGPNIAVVCGAVALFALATAGQAHAASKLEAGGLAEVPYSVVDINGASGGVVPLKGKDDKDGNAKFLYLKSDVGAGAPAPKAVTLGANDAAVAAPTGAELSGLLGVFTPNHANLRLGYASMVGDLMHQHQGFDIALTSSYATNGANAFNPLGVSLSPSDVNGRAVNFGFSVGYGGFNLDAAYLQGGSGIDYGYRGYDVGLGYQAGNWGTLLGFSAAQPTNGSVMDLMGTQGQYTMRLGAFYQVSPGFTFGGRLQYHDYKLFDSEQMQNRGEFFLNTNLNF